MLDDARTIDDITDAHLRKSNANYFIPETKNEALAAIAAMDEFALDFETTGLDPRQGAKVRLSSICGDKHQLLIDHFFVGDFSEYADAFLNKKIWVYNAKFEQKFIDFYRDDEEVTVWDVDFLKKVNTTY